MNGTDRATNGGGGTDTRYDVRLLETLKKAIGDILADHARAIAAKSRVPLEASAQADAEQPERNMAPNGPGLRLEGEAAIAGLAAQAGENASVNAPSQADPARVVLDTIAEMTRYPREILTPEALFDEDLGIDSLKRAEIVTALLNRFGQPPSDLKTLGPMPRTVGELTSFAVAYVSRSAAAAGRLQQLLTNDGDSRAATLRSHEAPPDLAARPATSANAIPGPVTGRKVPSTERPFEGKVALVTGSGDGLGKVIAKQMAELGAHVIINSAHSRERGEQTSEEILAGNGQATHVWGSFASTDHIERAFREIEQRVDRLDYYVHSAADEVLASLDKVTESHWERAFRTNIVGYHLCAMRAAKLMQKSGGGRIVALSSPGGKRYMEYYGVMGPVKAALESLTMYLAQELGPYNVQVNAVAALPVYGEQLSSFPDSAMVIPYWESRMRDGRLGNPEEISEAVIFLLTKAARKINGTTMLVDGGWSQSI